MTARGRVMVVATPRNDFYGTAPRFYAQDGHQTRAAHWGTPIGEWGLRLDFIANERALSPLDYAWLVEQIELRTGRAKPLAPSAPRKSPRTLSRLSDGQ